MYKKYNFYVLLTIVLSFYFEHARSSDQNIDRPLTNGNELVIIMGRVEPNIILRNCTDDEIYKKLKQINPNFRNANFCNDYPNVDELTVALPSTLTNMQKLRDLGCKAITKAFVLQDRSEEWLIGYYLRIRDKEIISERAHFYEYQLRETEGLSENDI